MQYDVMVMVELVVVINVRVMHRFKFMVAVRCR